VVHLSAPGQPEKINLAYIAGQNSMIVRELGNTRDDIKDLHGRLTDFLKQGYLTKEDCKECKDDREKVEEKRRGVSPRFAYILIPLIVGCLSVPGQNLRYIWHAFLVLVRGG
jgi:hypothetical protein